MINIRQGDVGLARIASIPPDAVVQEPTEVHGRRAHILAFGGEPQGATARAAVASTFGLRAEEYTPTFES